MAVRFRSELHRHLPSACKGRKRHKISIAHTELLNEDGTPNMVYLRIAEPNYPYEMQTDCYTLEGTGKTEEFMPSFTYHGFRFVRRIRPYRGAG